MEKPDNRGRYERSAGAVVFYENQDTGRLYLLLRYRGKKGGHWEFPRGHIEEREHEHHTALREIREETALRQITFLPDFRKVMRFYFKNPEGKTVTKDAVYFLAHARTLKITLSPEHLGYVWLPFRLALKHLTFDAPKPILEAAERYLNRAK